MNLILRKNGLGKGYLREIAQKLTDTRVAKTLRQALRYPLPAWLIRWGNCEPFQGEVPVLNTPEAIKRVSNKGMFRLQMQAGGISVPETTSHMFDVLNWLDEDRDRKIIVRPMYHSGGSDLHVMTYWNAGAIFDGLVGHRLYASMYIKKGREFRVFVVKGRVICVCEKFVDDPNQVAWNNAQGGHFQNIKFSDWPIKACVEAVKAFGLSGLDFGAVDVIQERDVPYVLEINSAPTITSEYRQSCLAKALAWTIGGQETPEVFPDRVKGWRRLVHPAISEECRRD